MNLQKDDYVKNIINNPPEHITITFTIKGLVSGNKVTIQSLNGNVYGEWTTDGTYTVDSDSLDDSYIYIYNGIAATKGNFTVDILPLYPNALVSDGVDDYCLVQDKYATNFSTNYYDYISGGSRATGTVEANKITITSVKVLGILIEEKAAVTKPIKIRVTGLPDGVSLLYNKQNIPQYTITKDGEYELPILEHTSGIGFAISSALSECNIVIEQLLLNKKSLVLNREDGYTVIAKRTWINEPTSGTFNPIASKASSNLTHEPNAFIFEWNRITNEARNYGCWSFGASTTLNSITNEDIVYQTSKSYNGTNRLAIGNNEDSDRLYLCSLINNTGFSNIALYSFILFNRDLTDEEIQWVKNNLMQ